MGMTPTHPLLQNLYDYADRNPSIHPVMPTLISITCRFIDDYGDELFPNNGENVITDCNDSDLKMRSYAVRLDLEGYQDDQAVGRDVERLAHVVKCIYAEIKAEMDGNQKTYQPYLLVGHGNIIVSPETFVPHLGFKTQYAYR